MLVGVEPRLDWSLVAGIAQTDVTDSDPRMHPAPLGSSPVVPCGGMGTCLQGTRTVQQNSRTMCCTSNDNRPCMNPSIVHVGITDIAHLETDHVTRLTRSRWVIIVG